MDKADNLKALIKITEAEIEYKELYLEDIKNQLFNEEWMNVGWDWLKQYLEDNPEDNYRDNPVVRNYRGRHGFSSYCDIREGKLCIGGYENNDNFPRSETLFIRKDLKSYKE